MRFILLLTLIFLVISCEKDPIFGLERGWLRSSELDNETNDLNQDTLPNYECSISQEYVDGIYDFVNPIKTIYRFGETYTITFDDPYYPGGYLIGQVNEIFLRLNSDPVYSFGTWLLISDNSRTFTLPNQSSEIIASNCYTIVVLDGVYRYESTPFTIY